jgi:hypothetical protein
VCLIKELCKKEVLNTYRLYICVLKILCHVHIISLIGKLVLFVLGSFFINHDLWCSEILHSVNDTYYFCCHDFKIKKKMVVTVATAYTDIKLHYNSDFRCYCHLSGTKGSFLRVWVDGSYTV